MTFNPIMQGTPAFEQPVQQPNAISTVLGLFGNLTSGEQQKAPDPTEGEKFTRDWGLFLQDQPAGRPIDNKMVRDFYFRYPQHQGRGKEYFPSIGVQTQFPTEVARDAQVGAFETWSKTPAGVAAYNAAAAQPAERREAFLLDRFNQEAQLDSEIAALDREASIYEKQGNLAAKQWETIAPQQKAMADDLISGSLNPLVQDVLSGQSVAVPPQLKARLGLRYDTVNMSNLALVLRDARTYVANTNRQGFASRFGADVLPPKELEDRILGGFDVLIAAADPTLNPTDRARIMNSLIEERIIETADQAGLAMALWAIKNLPPVTVNAIIGTKTEAMNRLLFDGTTGSIFSREQIASNVAGASSEDAKKAAGDAVAAMGNGVMQPEFFSVLKEAQKRTGLQIVDGETFKSVVTTNATSINDLTKSNPEFKQEFSDWLYSDINGTLTYIKRSLPTGIDLVYENGKFVAKLNAAGLQEFESFNKSVGFTANPETYANGLIKQLGNGMTVEVLNTKMANLGMLDVGEEVKGALDMQIGGGAGETAPKGSAGGDTIPSSWEMIRNGIFAGESGGDYDALFGFSNRPGGQFSNVKLTSMTVDQAIAFSSPEGPYGSWVKGQVGRIATPMGAYQVVGSTLKAAKEGLGLTGQEVMTPELQDKIGQWIYKTQGTAAWVGYRGPRSSYDPMGGNAPSTPPVTVAEATGQPQAGSSAPTYTPQDTAPAPQASPEARTETLSTAPVPTQPEASAGLQGASQSLPEASASKGSPVVDKDLKAFLDSLSADSIQVFKTEEAYQKALSEGRINKDDQAIVNGRVKNG